MRVRDEKTARLAELDSLLNMDENPGVDVDFDGEDDIEVDVEIAAKAEPMSAKSKPSLLATLERNTEKSRAMFGNSTEKSKREEITV